jgi:hypothetical protein
MTIVNPYYARVFIDSLANEKIIMWKGWNNYGSFMENNFPYFFLKEIVILGYQIRFCDAQETYFRSL